MLVREAQFQLPVAGVETQQGDILVLAAAGVEAIHRGGHVGVVVLAHVVFVITDTVVALVDVNIGQADVVGRIMGFDVVHTVGRVVAVPAVGEIQLGLDKRSGYAEFPIAPKGLFAAACFSSSVIAEGVLMPKAPESAACVVVVSIAGNSETSMAAMSTILNSRFARCFIRFLLSNKNIPLFQTGFLLKKRNREHLR